MTQIPRLFRGIALACAVASSFASPAIAQTVVQIRNTATLLYGAPGSERTIPSNTVTLERTKRPTSLSFRRLPANFQLTGLRCETAPVLTFTPAPITADELAKAPPLASLDPENSFVQVLEAPGENYDPTVRETAMITLTKDDFVEQVRLLETAPNSGVFAGAVPKAMVNAETSACDPSFSRSGAIALSFAGSDASFESAFSVLIDPLGFVFDSRTGAVLDGATVTLIDVATGKPSTQVFGDDGMSAYPNQLVTGGTATDSRGTVYTFAPGQFRFPLAPAGQYRLQVEPPKGYTAPSTATPASLAALQGPQGAYSSVKARSGSSSRWPAPRRWRSTFQSIPGSTDRRW